MTLVERNEGSQLPTSVRTAEFPECGLIPIDFLYPFTGRRENISYAPELAALGISKFRLRYKADGAGSSQLLFFITKEESICVNELLLERTDIEKEERLFRVDLAIKLPSLDPKTLNYFWGLYTLQSMGTDLIG